MSILIVSPSFYSERPHIIFFSMAKPRASSQFNPDRDKIFQFSDIKKFPDRGETNSAANGFKFGTRADLQAPKVRFCVSGKSAGRFRCYFQGDIEGRNHINFSFQKGLSTRSLDPMRAPIKSSPT